MVVRTLRVRTAFAPDVGTPFPRGQVGPHTECADYHGRRFFILPIQALEGSLHMCRVTKRAGAALAIGVLLAGLAGCGGDPTAKEVAALNQSNIQRVANLYTAFQTYKAGRGPKSEA